MHFKNIAIVKPILMRSLSLKTLFYFAFLLFVAHGVEEYLTELYTIDPSIQRFAYIIPFPISTQRLFLFTQFVLIVFLLVGFFVVKRRSRWSFFYTVIIGILCIFELDHLIRAVYTQRYYPGMITALMLVPFGFVFFRNALQSRTS